MGGGLLQLVAYGAQDIFLTGQPEVSFFKSVYRKHTNFAVESIKQTLSTTITKNTTSFSTIQRIEDLINKCLGKIIFSKCIRFC